MSITISLTICTHIVHSLLSLKKSHATTSVLLSFTHDCHNALDSNEEVCTVFFDLSQAFDIVPRLSLLYKLSCLQVSPFLLRWIHDYLSNRHQAVVLGGTTSNILPVLSGTHKDRF